MEEGRKREGGKGGRKRGEEEGGGAEECTKISARARKAIP